MTERKMLEPKDIDQLLGIVRGWTVTNGKLHKDFQFEDFIQAFGFMSSVALIAESMNHHPAWSNVYNKVAIDLNTHSEGGISRLDFEFARKVDALRLSLP
jgi:4a-hydroxytetrahydrobiopterin dehydratase